MPEVKISDSNRNSKSGSLQRKDKDKEIYESKITIHGRFHLKSDHTLLASEAYSYVHMNNQERLVKQAISEKAIFKFYESHLRVVKPNVFSSVKESKYPYENIEKFFVFSDYPKIVVFCIKMPTYRMAFLFECPSDEAANKACNIVEDYKVRHKSPDDNTMSDRTSEPSSSDDAIRRRPGGAVLKGGTFEGRSPSDSYSGDDGPGIMHSQSFERQSFPPDRDTPTRRQLSVLQSGEFGSRSPNMGRPVSVNSGVYKSGSLERRSATPDSRRPRSMLDGGPMSRPIINVSYDRNREYTSFSGSESPRPGSTHNHPGSRHKREQRSGAYPVSVLGRYRINDPREDFEMDTAQTYLNICLSNPRTANDKGELQLYPDCMKLVAMDSGHYDYQNIYRIYCFEADPTVLIFGLQEKNKYMYMLLRFKSQDALGEAFRNVTSRGDYKEFSDFKLSDRQRGAYHKANGSGNIERMSKTIALPSEREIETKRVNRQSYSSKSSVGSSIDEDRVVTTRMVGVHAAPPPRSSSQSSERNYEAEFTVLLNQMDNEPKTQYINSVVVDEVDDNRTTRSAMYLDREERTSRHQTYHDNDDYISASVSTRVEASYKPTNDLYVDKRRGSTQWVEEASYLDYKPGTGVIESDNGPVYMYCARQVRKENYAL